MYMYFLCIYKKTIILSLFRIVTLNFTMYILTILTCTLNNTSLDYINLISINISSLKSSEFITVKGQSKTNKLQKPITTQTSLNQISMNIFFTRKQESYKNKIIIILNTRKFRRSFYIPHILSILSSLDNSSNGIW